MDLFVCLQDMETIILAALHFDLVSVTPGHFLDAFFNILNIGMVHRERLKADTLRRINISLIGKRVKVTSGLGSQ